MARFLGCIWGLAFSYEYSMWIPKYNHITFAE